VTVTSSNELFNLKSTTQQSDDKVLTVLNGSPKFAEIFSDWFLTLLLRILDSEEPTQYFITKGFLFSKALIKH